MKITDIHTPWRDHWRQASFRGVPFFVDIGSKGSGRRTVLHQFPKRNTPYAEDMGLEAYAFTVTGYVIDAMAVKMFGYTDYTQHRDALEAALEDTTNEGPGILILPTRGTNYTMTCIRYNVVERRMEGGFAQFDMVFVEYGEALKPLAGNVLPSADVNQSADGAAQTGANSFNQHTGAPAAGQVEIGTPVVTGGG